MKRTSQSLAAEAKFRARVQELGGAVLEPEWLGVVAPHRLRCKAGHECSPRPNTVISGGGLCWTCAGSNPSAAEAAFRARIEALGATLLESEWLGKDTPHRVVCIAGHECTPTPGNVRKGFGVCRICAGQDSRAIEAEFRARLASFGAVLLEPKWLGAKRAHRIRCRHGHVSTPQPLTVRFAAEVCRVCAGRIWDAFYLVVNDDAGRLKFGISSGDPSSRIKRHYRDGYQRTVRSASGLADLVAPALERALITELPQRGHPPVVGREYYALSALSAAIEIIDATLAI